MHSPERVAANVELAGVVAEDDDIGEEAVVDDAAQCRLKFPLTLSIALSAGRAIIALRHKKA